MSKPGEPLDEDDLYERGTPAKACSCQHPPEAKPKASVVEITKTVRVGTLGEPINVACEPLEAIAEPIHTPCGVIDMPKDGTQVDTRGRPVGESAAQESLSCLPYVHVQRS